MNNLEILDIGKEAILISLKISPLTMLVGMCVGPFVSLFQALTQVQEMTLSFALKLSQSF